MGLNGSREAERGLCNALSSLTRGLYALIDTRGLLPSLPGVTVVLVTFELHVRRISPRLLVITSSSISPTSAVEVLAPNSPS